MQNWEIAYNSVKYKIQAIFLIYMFPLVMQNSKGDYIVMQFN